MQNFYEFYDFQYFYIFLRCWIKFRILSKINKNGKILKNLSISLKHAICGVHRRWRFLSFSEFFNLFIFIFLNINHFLYFLQKKGLGSTNPRPFLSFKMAKWNLFFLKNYAFVFWEILFFRKNEDIFKPPQPQVL